MKKNKVLLGLSTVLAVTLITTGCGKEIEVKNGSKVAVSIKGDKFTATEYYNKIKEENISSLVDMIDHSILDEKYKEDDEQKKYVENQMNQIKSYYGNDQSNYEKVLKQYFGVDSEKELEEKIILEYRRKKAAEDYVNDNIKDDEINKYYKESVTGQVKASHILIAVNVKEDATDDEKEKAENAAKKKAEKIIKQLDEGKKFEDLAKKYSDDSSNASNGGDLGYFDLKDMVTEFSDAVKALEKNKYTKEPVKTEYGYHIILKTGQKEKPKLKEVKKEIKETLTEQKMKDDSTLYYVALREVREKNKIKWNDDTLKKAYDDYMKNLIDSAKSSN